MIFVVVDIYFRGTALLIFLHVNFINYLGTLIPILSSNFVLLILISTGAVPEGSDEPDQPDVDDLYNDFEFQEGSPMDFGYEEISEGEIADNM